MEVKDRLPLRIAELGVAEHPTVAELHLYTWRFCPQVRLGG
jgi:hypothetical protein